MFGTGEGFTADAIITGFLSADRIEAGSITTSKLASDVGSSIDISDNVTITGGVPKVATSTVVIDGSGIDMQTGGTFTIESENFEIDSEGNVTMTGEVNAASGDIGGWTIAAGDLHSGTTTGQNPTYVALNSDSDVAYAIWAGNENGANASFSVTKTGSLVAKDGEVGGWDIGANQLSSGTTTNFVAMNSDTSTDYAIWAGNATAGNAPFSVKRNGQVKASSGTIGGWTLSATTLQSGSGSTRVALSSSGTYAIWAGSETNSSAPFSVTNAGAVKAVSGNVGGWSLANNSLTSGTGSTYVALNSDANSTYAIWAGNATAGSAPFRVERDGSVVATDGSIGGWSMGNGILSSGSGTGYVAMNSNTTDTFALWAGNETAANAPFRVMRDGTVILTKLQALNAQGQPTTVDLRNYQFWRLSYHTIRYAQVSADSKTLTIRYDDGTDVNFNKASEVDDLDWEPTSYTPTYNTTTGNINGKINLIALDEDDEEVGRKDNVDVFLDASEAVQYGRDTKVAVRVINGWVGTAGGPDDEKTASGQCDIQFGTGIPIQYNVTLTDVDVTTPYNNGYNSVTIRSVSEGTIKRTGYVYTIPMNATASNGATGSGSTTIDATSIYEEALPESVTLTAATAPTAISGGWRSTTVPTVTLADGSEVTLSATNITVTNVYNAGMEGATAGSLGSATITLTDAQTGTTTFTPDITYKTTSTGATKTINPSITVNATSVYNKGKEDYGYVDSCTVTEGSYAADYQSKTINVVATTPAGEGYEWDRDYTIDTSDAYDAGEDSVTVSGSWAAGANQATFTAAASNGAGANAGVTAGNIASTSAGSYPYLVTGAVPISLTGGGDSSFSPTITINATPAYEAGQNSVNVVKGSWGSNSITFSPSAGTGSSASVHLVWGGSWGSGETANLYTATITDGGATAITGTINASNRYSAGSPKSLSSVTLADGDTGATVDVTRNDNTVVQLPISIDSSAVRTAGADSVTLTKGWSGTTFSVTTVGQTTAATEGTTLSNASSWGTGANANTYYVRIRDEGGNDRISDNVSAQGRYQAGADSVTLSEGWTGNTYTVTTVGQTTAKTASTFIEVTSGSWDPDTNKCIVSAVADRSDTVATLEINAQNRYNAGMEAATAGSLGSATIALTDAQTGTTTFTPGITYKTTTSGATKTIYPSITVNASSVYAKGKTDYGYVNSCTVTPGSYSADYSSRSINVVATTPAGTGYEWDQDYSIDTSDAYQAGIGAVGVVKGSWAGGACILTPSTSGSTSQTITLSEGTETWSGNVATVPVLDGGSSTRFSVTVDATSKVDAVTVSGSWSGNTYTATTAGQTTAHTASTYIEVTSGSWDTDTNTCTVSAVADRSSTVSTLTINATSRYNAGKNSVGISGSWNGATYTATTVGKDTESTVTTTLTSHDVYQATNGRYIYPRGNEVTVSNYTRTAVDTCGTSHRVPLTLSGPNTIVDEDGYVWRNMYYCSNWDTLYEKKTLNYFEADGTESTYYRGATRVYVYDRGSKETYYSIPT